MPRETGLGGKQIQFPMDAVREFFRVDDTKIITLTERDIPRSRRELTMTVYPNNTARLVIQELEYRDRPCVIVFHKSVPTNTNSRSFENPSFRDDTGACSRSTAIASRDPEPGVGES